MLMSHFFLFSNYSSRYDRSLRYTLGRILDQKKYLSTWHVNGKFFRPGKLNRPIKFYRSYVQIDITVTKKYILFRKVNEN